MKSTVGGLETVYLDRVVPLRDLKMIADMYAVDVVDTTHKARNGSITFPEALSHIDKAQTTIDQRWKAYVQTKLVAEEERQVQTIKGLMEKAAPRIEKLKSMLKAGDREGLAAFAANELYPLIDPLSDGYSHLIEIQLDVAKAEYDAGESRYKGTSMMLAAGGAIGLIIGIGLALPVSYTHLTLPTSDLV